MNNWGIRQHIIALALLPILVVAIILTSYFTLSQLDFISDSQVRHGNIIARQLAPASEYGVFSGNLRSLDAILKYTLSDEDIVTIKITDADDNPLISVTDNDTSRMKKSIWHQLASEELTTFKEPIRTQTLDIEPLDSNDNNPNKHEEIIGYIEITLTSTNINAIKLKTIAKSSLITLFILSISMFLALRLSKQISKPVKILTNAVKKISSGNYNTRINHQASGDLGTLESCVNIMAEELQNSREDLEAKIEESTKELQETMEELEIRNVELDIARSNALQASKAKTEFLANMSHELRTPLGGILGFSELLESTNLEHQQRDYSEIIKKSANNLLNIIDGVLDLSKIESGKLEVNFTEFNIIDIAEEVIDLLIPVAYEKDIDLFYYIDATTPRLINTDSARVRQILINLIGNAIKFTEKGFVSLHISAEPETDSFSKLKFSVVDTGIGMNSAHQERLFKAFTQADKSIERKFGGTGLGLVISKKLALLLNGDINFESQYNKGSTFTLSILAKCKQQENNLDHSLLGKHICLIDPLETCSLAIQTMLDSWGCIVNIYPQVPDELSGYDLIIVNLSKSCMYDDKIKSLTPKHSLNIPLLAIASTRSHKELNNIKNFGFNDAIFHSAKHDFIRQSVLNLINHDITPINSMQPIQKNTFDWSGLNILVVDDNDINLKLAEIILKKNGAHVTTASSGHQGIDLSNKQDFDMIFMDLQMPDMDGYESSRLIRTNKKNDNTVIIALTANAMATKESNRIEQCGINDILIKPFNETCIQNTIDQWLLNNTHQQNKIKPIQHKIEKFSKSEAVELAAGNINLANELTSMLLNELPEHMKIINEAFSDNNIERLRQQTHKLHGATRCCGTPALRNAAEQLELDINNGISENYLTDTHLLIDEIEKLLNADHSELMI
ncbi:MAG: ATP-binding protein [Gammaproteobacteria bacterium]|nr:ATP-binding protein [Gammaproteobacteria bacterium]